MTTSHIVLVPISAYTNKGDGLSAANEPEVLLWHERYGYALGRVFRWDAGEVLTISAAHGFNYTHFTQLIHTINDHTE